MTLMVNMISQIAGQPDDFGGREREEREFIFIYVKEVSGWIILFSVLLGGIFALLLFYMVEQKVNKGRQEPQEEGPQEPQEEGPQEPQEEGPQEPQEEGPQEPVHLFDHYYQSAR